MSFDAFLEIISPLSGSRHVGIQGFASICLSKLRDLSQLFVVAVVDDDAESVLGFKEAAHHSGVVEHLVCTFNRKRLWKGPEEVKRLRHDESLFATKGLLIVRLPSIEDIPGVRQEKTVVFSLGTFQNFKELVSYLRCSRDTFVCGTSKD